MSIAPLPPEIEMPSHLDVSDSNGIAELPTHLDLPHTDDKPVENAYQPLQTMLLTGALAPHLDRLHPGGDYFVGADTGIYWQLTRPREAGCRAPDWYYVPNVPRMIDGAIRRSYVMWQELEAPLLVIEYVSGNGSEERDRTPLTGKFWVYERAIKAAHYLIWHPLDARLEAYELVQGRYQPMIPDNHGRIGIARLQVAFGAWDGEYIGNAASWLRAWDLNGNIFPTTEESAEVANRRYESEKHRAESERVRAETEKHRAESERVRAETEKHRAESERVRAESETHRAEIEKHRAEKFAAKLRELGVEPDSL